jgi:NNP family nitrate/nitrite transporter-like MFS transporter
MGLSKQYLGSYVWGFVFFAALSLIMLGVMRVMQIRWTRTWAEKGGRARVSPAAAASAAPITGLKKSPTARRPVRS